MKNIFTLLLALLYYNIQAQPVGKIVKMNSGEYQIEYDNQLLNVYFNYNPSGDFDHLVGLVLTDAEEYEFTNKIRNQMDQFPADFRGKFLGCNIYPAHIKHSSEGGYYYDNQIIVELSKSRVSSFVNETQESIYCHELAHHFLDKMRFRSETKSLKDYLRTLRRSNSGKNFNNSNSVFTTGYVTHYAYGLESDNYKAREEIAEIFSYLVSNHEQQDLIKYVKTNPNSLLAKKTYKVIEYLHILDPTFTNEYFFGSNSQKGNLSQTELAKQKILGSIAGSSRVDQTIPVINTAVSTYKKTPSKTTTYTTSIYPKYTEAIDSKAENKRYSAEKQKTKQKKKKNKKKDGEAFKSIVGSIALVGIITFAISSDYNE